MKRETLERNLKRVVTKIEDECTPLRIEELWGLGSFFRGKEKPGDVDILAFYENVPELDEEFNLFREFIKSLSDNEKDRNILENIVSNEPRTMEIFKDHCPRLRLDAWAKYTKASFNDSSVGRHHISREVITRKTLLEGARGIHVSLFPISGKDDYFRSMPTQNFILIWSKDERDVDKNLQQAPVERMTLILAEMRNFAIQVERFKSYYYVLSNVSKWVIDSIKVHMRIPDEDQIAEKVQSLGSERGILDAYLKWILKWGIFSELSRVDAPNHKEKVTNLDIDSEIAQILDSVRDDSELGVICESMRSEIKEFQSRCTFARGLLRRLLDTDRYSSPSIEERIARCATWALNGVPLNEAKDDTKRWVLSDLGLEKLSENIVLLDWGSGRSNYSLAESEEELQELTEQSMKGKMERKYAKYIKAIIRKAFPKNTEVDVDFYSVIGEDGLAVPQKIYLEAATREEDNTNFLKAVENSAFVISDSYLAARKAQLDTNYIEAILELDISQLNGDRKLIKKLIESKLTLSPEILSV